MVAHRIWNANIFTSNLVWPLTTALFVWVQIIYDINLHILNAVRARLSFNLAPLLLKTCLLISSLNINSGKQCHCQWPSQPQLVVGEKISPFSYVLNLSSCFKFRPMTLWLKVGHGIHLPNIAELLAIASLAEP